MEDSIETFNRQGRSAEVESLPSKTIVNSISCLRDPDQEGRGESILISMLIDVLESDTGGSGIFDVRPDIFLDLGRGNGVEWLLMFRTNGLSGRPG